MSWWEHVVEGTTHLRVALEAEREVRVWKSIAHFTTGDLTSLHHALSPENAVTAHSIAVQETATLPHPGLKRTFRSRTKH